jgi:DNA polymerase III epsilon subunit-like protein
MCDKPKFKLRLIPNRNSGKKWSDADDKELLGLVSSSSASIILGRSNESIDARLKNIAYQQFIDGSSLKTVQLSTGMELYEILSLLHVKNIKILHENDDYTIAVPTPIPSPVLATVLDPILDLTPSLIPILSTTSNPTLTPILSPTCLVIDIEYTSKQYIIEIYWEVRSISDGKILKQQYFLINQEGIKVDNTYIHGITETLTRTHGVAITTVLGMLMTDIKDVDVIVSHNFKGAEYNVIMKELIRNNMPLDELHNKPYTCTMERSRQIHKNINHSLDTVYMYCFGHMMRGHHTSISDTVACAQIYYKMVHSLDSIEIVNKYRRPYCRPYSYT